MCGPSLGPTFAQPFTNRPQMSILGTKCKGPRSQTSMLEVLILTSPTSPPTHLYTSIHHSSIHTSCTHMHTQPIHAHAITHTCTHTRHTHSSSHSNSQSQGHTHAPVPTFTHSLIHAPPPLFPHCCWASYIPAGGARFVHRAVTHLFSGYPNR